MLIKSYRSRYVKCQPNSSAMTIFSLFIFIEIILITTILFYEFHYKDLHMLLWIHSLWMNYRKQIQISNIRITKHQFPQIQIIMKIFDNYGKAFIIDDLRLALKFNHSIRNSKSLNKYLDIQIKFICIHGTSVSIYLYSLLSVK